MGQVEIMVENEIYVTFFKTSNTLWGNQPKNKKIIKQNPDIKDSNIL